MTNRYIKAVLISLSPITNIRAPIQIEIRIVIPTRKQYSTQIEQNDFCDKDRSFVSYISNPSKMSEIKSFPSTHENACRVIATARKLISQYQYAHFWEHPSE